MTSWKIYKQFDGLSIENKIYMKNARSMQRKELKDFEQKYFILMFNFKKKILIAKMLNQYLYDFY